MRKVKEKNCKARKVSNRKMNMLVELVAQNGDRFGNDIIEMMELKNVNPVTLGVFTIGLAKAWAVVKNLGKQTNVDVNTLHQKETADYCRELGMWDNE